MNPFRPNILEDPWAEVGDLPDFGESLARVVERRIKEVRQDGRSRAILVLGQHGAGKTHFLMRLRRMAQGIPDEQAPFFFSYVPPFVRPSGAHEHFLAHVICSLRRGTSGKTRALTRFFSRSLAKLAMDDECRLPMPPPGSTDGFNRFLEGALALLRQRYAHFPPDLFSVLRAMFRSSHERSAMAALEGLPLHEEELGELSMDGDFTGERAWLALTGLGILARYSGPLVIGVDQIESLEGTGHADALQHFGSVMVGLRERVGSSVLVFTCLLDRWQESIRGDFEAMGILDWFGKDVYTLASPDAGQAKRLVELRLADRPMDGVGEKELQKILKRARTPRALLRECARVYERVHPIGSTEKNEGSS